MAVKTDRTSASFFIPFLFEYSSTCCSNMYSYHVMRSALTVVFVVTKRKLDRIVKKGSHITLQQTSTLSTVLTMQARFGVILLRLKCIFMHLSCFHFNLVFTVFWMGEILLCSALHILLLLVCCWNNAIFLRHFSVPVFVPTILLTLHFL